MCSHIESEGIDVQRMRIDKINIDEKNVNESYFKNVDVIIEHVNSDGTYELRFTQAKNQFIRSARELLCDYKLDSSSTLNFVIGEETAI